MRDMIWFLHRHAGSPSVHWCGAKYTTPVVKPSEVQRNLLMSHRTRWETTIGRYDEHNSKFSLSMKPKFNRPIGERNHF
jgi:hypothetical protein